MYSKTAHFHLRVIDIKNILPHEEYDSSRALPIIQNIKKTKIIVNPILVTHLEGERYVQLDGMNRYTALKKLKIRSILTQVLDYNDQETVDLSTWCHLHEIPKGDFLQSLSRIENINIKEVGEKYLRRRYISDDGTSYLCSLVFRDGSIVRCNTNGKLSDKIKVLNQIVDIYKTKIRRDVMPEGADLEDVRETFAVNEVCKTLVIFPTFTRHQIINLVRQGLLFPGGVTRFIIKRRCLDVRYPLEYLDSPKSEDEKNLLLEKFLSSKSYRLYEEPTIYFEP